jgi:hypothetical protein
MAKKVIRLTESELTDLIQKIVVETRMSEMDAPEMEEGELEEAMFGPSAEEKEERRVELIRKIDDLLEEYELTDQDLQNSVDSVLRQAEENGFDGEVKITSARRSGRPILVYKSNPTKFQKSGFYKNVVKPMVGGLKGGHEFGSGQ